jgi:ligand-binding sensor domain-containing protein
MNNVCLVFNRVYASSELGILVYDKQTQSTFSFDKTSGLTDIKITSLQYLSALNLVAVGYENGAFNFFDKNHSVTANLLFKYDFSVLGSKKINDFCYSNQLKKLFIASDYGVLIFNVNKNEISDTYSLYNNNQVIKINKICIVDDTIYMATNNGLYKAWLYDNLIDFNNWQAENDFTGSNVSSIVEFNNYLLVNVDNAGYNQDVLYKKHKQDTSWQVMMPNTENKKLIIQNNHLILPHNFYIDVFDTALQAVLQIDSADNRTFNPVSVAYDGNIYWIATERDGLIKCYADNDGEFINVNAPVSNTVQNMDISGNDIWIASGNIDARWFNQWQSTGFIHYNLKTGIFTNINAYTDSTLNNVYDVVSVKIHPKNDSIVYFGTWGSGLVEYKKNTSIRMITDTNSLLKSRNEFQWIGAYGFDWDMNANMWISNSFTDSPLVFYNPYADEWHKYAFSNKNEVTPTTTVGHVVVDSVYHYKWINLPKEGEIIVFDDNNSPGYYTDDNYTVLEHSVNLGHIPGYIINDMQYHNAKMWVATDAGLVYFDLSDPIFSSTINAHYLWENSVGSKVPILENEEITAILFDDENNLWVGTRNNGIYHLSPDFKEILHHFNTENSPITDNEINDIVYCKLYKTFYVATQQGILSFKKNPEFIHNNFEFLTTFPNPTKNKVTVSGLAKDAYIMIFSITGKHIYSGQANGNTFTWNLRNTFGEKITPGVYLIMSYNHNFSEKRTAKLIVTE